MSPEPRLPILNDSQRSVVGSALTLLAFVGSLALVIVALYVFGRLLAFFSSVLWPLAVAGVMALMLRPLVQALERRLGLRRTTAVILLYTAVVLLASGGLLLIVPALVTQLIDFVAYLPTLWDAVSNYVTTHYPDWIELAQKHLSNPSVKSIADSLASESKGFLTLAMPGVRAAFGGIVDVFAFFTHVAIVPVYLFFFLLMRGEPTGELGRHLPFLRPGVRDDVVFLASEFVSIVESFFRGQLLIGLCMGVLLAAGFTVIGLKFGQGACKERLGI